MRPPELCRIFMRFVTGEDLYKNTPTHCFEQCWYNRTVTLDAGRGEGDKAGIYAPWIFGGRGRRSTSMMTEEGSIPNINAKIESF